MRGKQAPIAVRGRVFLARRAPGRPRRGRSRGRRGIVGAVGNAAGRARGGRAGGTGPATVSASTLSERGVDPRKQRGGRTARREREPDVPDRDPNARADFQKGEPNRLALRMRQRRAQIRVSISPRAQYTSS